MPRLITFGGLSIQGSNPINGAANPRSRLAILAVLAVQGGRGVRREKLTALFWPDSDEERARSALRQALFTMKRDIGAGEVTLGGTDLRLNPEVLTADVIDFDAAMTAGRFEEAADLYRGPFLDGLYLRDLPEFERWVEDHRARYASLFGQALERAAAAAAGRGDTAASARWWERRAGHDPLSARVALSYMDALVLAGDRERAIRHASAYSQLVKKELDAEPDPDVLRAAERLRRAATPVRETPKDPASDVPPGFAASTGPEDSSPRARRSRRVVLTGAAAVALGLGVTAFALLSSQPPVHPGHVELEALRIRVGDSGLVSVGSSRVDLQACKLEYSIVSPK